MDSFRFRGSTEIVWYDLQFQKQLIFLIMDFYALPLLILELKITSCDMLLKNTTQLSLLQTVST